jgi:hypothetical protein
VGYIERAHSMIVKIFSKIHSVNSIHGKMC